MVNERVTIFLAAQNLHVAGEIGVATCESIHHHNVGEARRTKASKPLAEMAKLTGFDTYHELDRCSILTKFVRRRE